MLSFFKNFALRSNLLFYIFVIIAVIFVVFGLSETPPQSQLLPTISPTAEPSTTLTTTSISSQQKDTEKNKKIYIDIQGAINFPGVYELTQGQRISDAIAIAGELSDKADKKWVAQNINRAVILNDGDKLYIPTYQEAEQFKASPAIAQPSVSHDLQLGYFANNEPANTSSILPISTANTKDLKISLNQSTAGELETLPGIGAVRAQKIVQGRPYQKIEDLVDRKILYRSLFEKIKDQITI